MGSLQLIASANADSGTRTTAFAFTSIPQTYTDLLLYLSLRGTDGGTEGYAKIFINNNETTAYSLTQAQGAGTSVIVAQNTGLDQWRFIIPNSGGGSLEFSATYVYIPLYTLTNINKQVSISSNQTNTSSGGSRNTNEVVAFTGQTSAINRLDIFCMSGNLQQYSSVYLYGIDSTP